MCVHVHVCVCVRECLACVGLFNVLLVLEDLLVCNEELQVNNWACWGIFLCTIHVAGTGCAQGARVAARYFRHWYQRFAISEAVSEL